MARVPRNTFDNTPEGRAAYAQHLRESSRLKYQRARQEDVQRKREHYSHLDDQQFYEVFLRPGRKSKAALAILAGLGQAPEAPKEMPPEGIRILKELERRRAENPHLVVMAELARQKLFQPRQPQYTNLKPANQEVSDQLFELRERSRMNAGPEVPARPGTIRKQGYTQRGPHLFRVGQKITTIVLCFERFPHLLGQ